MPVNFGECVWQHVSKLAEGPQRDMSSEKIKMLPNGSRDCAQRYVKQLRAKNKCIWLEHCSFAQTKLQTRIDFIRSHCLCAKTWGLLRNREWYKIITKLYRALTTVYDLLKWPYFFRLCPVTEAYVARRLDLAIYSQDRKFYIYHSK